MVTLFLENPYTSGFYSFKSAEEKWAYWAKYIYYHNFEKKHTALYQKLYQLIVATKKNYFAITSNVDDQFINNDFAEDKVFAIQGSCSKL